MSSTELGLRETARRHDISPGYLSQRVREGKAAKGRDLTPYATLDSEGVIEGFVFPKGYDFPVSPEAEPELRENPSFAVPNVPNAKNKHNGTPSSSGAGDVMAEASSDWQSQAVCLASDLCEEKPARAATALLETAKLAGATGAGLVAGKYVYDRTHHASETSGETRSNPSSEDKSNGVASKQSDSVLPAVGVGLLTFLGADYGLRGDDSLAVRSAQWITGLFDKGEATRVRDSAGQASRQIAAGDGTPAQNAGTPRSSDGASSSVPDLDWKRLAEEARQ